MRKAAYTLMAIVLAVAIGSAGFMLGYANGQSVAPARAQAPADTPAASTPAPAPTNPPATASPSEDQAFQIFWEAWRVLQAEYYGNDLPDPKNLAYNAIKGVIFGLDDQFTSFIPPQTAAIIEEDATGEFSGIGAYVQLNQNRVLQITRIFADSPAEKAGLKAGDLIIAVNGTSIVGDDLYAQIAKVRGPAGSQATLSIMRGDNPPFDVTLTRATIKIPLVESKMINGEVAYVSLSSFDSSTTAQQLSDAVEQLLLRNPKGLILDLRSNPGGFLDQAIAVSDLFLKSGVVLYERSKTGAERTFTSSDEGIAQDIPLVVLVNGGSASAAEIVAGAIQDRGRGQLIGAKTFGKGSVQQINHLSDGSQLRVTIAHWFTPNNREIHGKGLEPDIVVAAGDDPAKDPQLDRAVEYILNGK